MCLFFLGSQELHVAPAAPPPAAFNKFSSLDRRTLARRHQQGNNLKLFPPQSGAESLPPTSSHHHYAPSLVFVKNNNNNLSNNNNNINGSDGKTSKDSVERRHSSYDPHNRSANRYRPLANNSDPSRSVQTSLYSYRSLINFFFLCRCPPTNGTKSVESRLSAMNINGLPDPYANSGPVSLNPRLTGSNQNQLTSAQLYSSQESLVSLTRNQIRSSGHHQQRPGAGTPQFQNLNGTIRTSSGSRTGSGSVTNLGPHPQPHNVTSVTLNAPGSRGGNTIHVMDSTSSSRGSSSGSDQGGMSNETPSPSDSAVGDLESMLKEKDTEINYLRETMEQNEQVIFKVSMITRKHFALVLSSWSGLPAWRKKEMKTNNNTVVGAQSN